MARVVVADYDYDATDTGQLSFKEGDRIVVIDEDETGWWTGRLEKGGQEGYFPATYIREADGAASSTTTTNTSSGEKKKGLFGGKKKEKKSEQKSLKIETARKEGGGRTGTGDGKSPSVDYTNYFANAQKVQISVPDAFDGEENAASENYYAAEVLNLHFNPNSRTRYGLASHYMSMFAAITTVGLATSSWSWSDGSPYLFSQGLASEGFCLFLGLYGFFGGILVFLWEYTRGDIRSRKAFPFRSAGYFVMGLPLLFQLPTALAGVLWMNTTIFSTLAWVKKETYERKKRRGPPDERTALQKFMEKISPSRIAQGLKDKVVSIRQQSQSQKYLFVIVYLLFNVIYISIWCNFYEKLVKTVNEGVFVTVLTVNGEEPESPFPPFTIDELKALSNDNTGLDEVEVEEGVAVILSEWFPMAKMFGNLLDINCAFILFPVCRSFISTLYNLSTDQRGFAKTCNFLLSFMPLDKALQFHKLCAFLIVVGTVFHTWAHFNHYADVPATYDAVFGPTVWLSGSLIILCMHFLFCTSFAAVRHGKFELFWYTHHLFVIFFISILFHGKGSVNPNFWKWFIVPGALYMLERTLRELKARQAVGVVSVTHMNNKNARIICLELEKTGPIRDHKEGQYVFIKAPIISKFQWHPFTISSPPDAKHLTLHIRNMGEGSWTDRLQQFFQAMNPRKAYGELYHRTGDELIPKTVGPDGNYLICIDGPMAAPTQHLGQYKTSIVVGAGIGVTPVRATLQSIIYYRFGRGMGDTFPNNAYCVWIVNFKQLDAYRFMCRSLKEAEDELFNLRQKNQGMASKLFQMHIFVTSTPKTKEDWAKNKYNPEEVANPENDFQREMALWGQHYKDDSVADAQKKMGRATAPFTEEDIWRCLREPSDEPTQIGDIIIHKGRPKWDQFFQPIQQTHRGQKIGVMFCGPPIIATDLKKSCGKFTDFGSNTVFVLHKENF